jgi:hypothetical protein
MSACWRGERQTDAEAEMWRHNEVETDDDKIENLGAEVFEAL